MRAKYENLFYIYKRVCEKNKNAATEEQIRYSVRMVNSFRDELYGMTVLMHEMDVLTLEELENEQEKIRKTFSVSDMLGVFEVDGEIYRLKGRG